MSSPAGYLPERSEFAYGRGVPNRLVTIVDLARELGMSKTTVSDALNGRGRVSQATRDRVLAVASELGYRVNRAARSMRTSTNGAVGLYIPPVARAFAFYMEFAFGAADAAARLDVDLTFFARQQDPAHPRQYGVDGAIVVDPLPDDPTVGMLLDAGVPVVTAGTDLSPAASRVSAVYEADHIALERQVLDRLRAFGVRRPAFVASDAVFASSWARDVITGYDEWCVDNDVDPARVLAPISAQEHELEAILRELVGREGVDALVCGPQGFAARSVPHLAGLGITAGPDFPVASLVADPLSELPDPAISVVDLAPAPYGKGATMLLGEVLSWPEPATGVRRVHPATVRFAEYLR